MPTDVSAWLLQHVDTNVWQGGEGTMAGKHIVYGPGRVDSRLEASEFPDAGLEVITFARTQVNRLHHLVRTPPAVAPESAGGSVISASENVESSSQPDGEAELGSAEKLSAGGSPTADNTAGLSEADGETAEHVTEDEANDEVAAEESPADDLGSLQPRTASSDEEAASNCEAEGEMTPQELPASQQPFLLVMHSNARADGMVRHQSGGTASCCCFEKRRDGLIQRDVLYSRSNSTALRQASERSFMPTT